MRLRERLELTRPARRYPNRQEQLPRMQQAEFLPLPNVREQSVDDFDSTTRSNLYQKQSHFHQRSDRRIREHTQGFLRPTDSYKVGFSRRHISSTCRHCNDDEFDPSRNLQRAVANRCDPHEATFGQWRRPRPSASSNHDDDSQVYLPLKESSKHELESSEPKCRFHPCRMLELHVAVDECRRRNESETLDFLEQAPSMASRLHELVISYAGCCCWRHCRADSCSS